ncbi:MAG: hypothetical protein KJ048_05945, partial [Dehalococcoidia bacterium]|nr:hypothetical protein [Dehalococcoidia bacterium]
MPPTPRSALGRGLSAFTLVAALAVALLPSPRSARAACGDAVEEPDVVFAFNPPLSGFEVRGNAPLDVTVTWVPGATVPAGSAAFLDWGDGSVPTPFHGTDCGDGIAMDWPPQSHAHTYGSPGNYTLSWAITSVAINLSVPIGFVVVEQGQTPTPTATSTLAPAPPTPAPPAVVASAVVPEPATTAATSGPTAAVTPSPSPTRVSPSATHASATPTAMLPVVAAPADTPTSTGPVAPEADIPEALSAMPRLDQIATDTGTIATNLALAGVTLWVLFSSVLLNQVLQEHRSEIDERTSR